MAKISNLANPVVSQIKQLRGEIMYSAAMGKYKEFTTATKKHAEIAVKNFDIAKNVQAPKISAPLFSIAGLRMMWVCFLNLFRTKTPAEKELRRLAQQDRMYKTGK